MNREIKFRGHNGVDWLYASEISIVEVFANDENMQYMPNYKSNLNQDDISNWDSVSYVGQYTGLKDRNGKEIYEGDIVFLNSDEDEEYDIENGTYMVKMVFGAWVLDRNFASSFPLLHSETHNIKVIGNIYENKELLEV